MRNDYVTGSALATAYERGREAERASGLSALLVGVVCGALTVGAAWLLTVTL